MATIQRAAARVQKLQILEEIQTGNLPSPPNFKRTPSFSSPRRLSKQRIKTGVAWSAWADEVELEYYRPDQAPLELTPADVHTDRQALHQCFVVFKTTAVPDDDSPEDKLSTSSTTAATATGDPDTAWQYAYSSVVQQMYPVVGKDCVVSFGMGESAEDEWLDDPLGYCFSVACITSAGQSPFSEPVQACIALPEGHDQSGIESSVLASLPTPSNPEAMEMPRLKVKSTDEAARREEQVWQEIETKVDRLTTLLQCGARRLISRAEVRRRGEKQRQEQVSQQQEQRSQLERAQCMQHEMAQEAQARHKRAEKVA
jgi:hypothetical protein